VRWCQAAPPFCSLDAAWSFRKRTAVEYLQGRSPRRCRRAACVHSTLPPASRRIPRCPTAPCSYAALDIVTKTGFAYLLISGREAIARYGSVWGQLNTGMDIDFPIARSTYTGSGSAYAAEPTPAVTFGEQRDLAFAQLHAATNTGLTKRNV
jgi:hypothetical protein